jgi:hypothetical protein
MNNKYTEEDFKCRPIHPEIHGKEDRKWYKLPACTCWKCIDNGPGDNPLDCLADGSYYK